VVWIAPGLYKQPYGKKQTLSAMYLFEEDLVKILVLGSGLMGPAAAFNAMSDPQVSQVTLR